MASKCAVPLRRPCAVPSHHGPKCRAHDAGRGGESLGLKGAAACRPPAPFRPARFARRAPASRLPPGISAPVARFVARRSSPASPLACGLARPEACVLRPGFSGPAGRQSRFSLGIDQDGRRGGASGAQVRFSSRGRPRGGVTRPHRAVRRIAGRLRRLRTALARRARNARRLPAAPFASNRPCAPPAPSVDSRKADHRENRHSARTPRPSRSGAWNFQHLRRGPKRREASGPRPSGGCSAKVEKATAAYTPPSLGDRAMRRRRGAGRARRFGPYHKSRRARKRKSRSMRHDDIVWADSAFGGSDRFWSHPPVLRRLTGGRQNCRLRGHGQPRHFQT